MPLLVGFIDLNDGAGRPFRNAAALLQRGQPMPRKFHKSLLPTYDVFDEDRYFEPAEARGRWSRSRHACVRRHDLRGYLDGQISAAAALRQRPGRARSSSKARR